MASNVQRLEDFWVPQRRLTLRQARRRSDLVKMLRMLFTAAAAISAGTLIGYLVQNAITQSTFGKVAISQAVTMKNPRFIGRDAEGMPYLITATSAQRRVDQPSIVDLFNPSLEDGMSSTVRAPSGVFDEELQTLELFEDVVLTDSSGNRFVSTHAEVFIKENRVIGLEPLSGEGPIGKMRSNTYEVQSGGDKILLRGDVWTEIIPD